MRKFYIGLISLAVVLVLFTIYSRWGTTNQPDISRRSKFIDSVEDSNVVDIKEEVGRIGDVGVGTVKKAYFEDRNEKNQKLERTWGFEILLHESGDLWEIEKPYMNIYQRNLTCFITADTGTVQVETVVGKSTPKDATFTSNVVIHIVPAGSSSVKESHIYLDDITFLSEKSLLSTANSVRFVSDNASMLGKGLELVYDDVLERLEYLWIKQLDSLHIKNSQMSAFSDKKNQSQKSAGNDDKAPVQLSKGPAAASVKTTAQTSTTQQVPEQAESEYYKCLFSKNVFVDSPDQLVFAQEEIFIDDILWSKNSGGDPNEAAADAQTVPTDLPNNVAVDNLRGVDKADVQAAEPNAPSDKLQDITITCDNGFIIVLEDYPKIFEKIYETAKNVPVSNGRLPDIFNSAEGRKTFLAPKIDYNALTGDIISNGASELKFYTVDLGRSDTNQPAMPVTVTAKKQVRFLPTSNLAVFEEDCRCNMIQTDPNLQQEYILLAPKLNIELAEETDKQSSSLAPGIKHFTADGGLVRFQSIKKAGQRLLGWIKLESSKFDYNPGNDLFIATGPGIIEMDNSKISPSKTETDKFSLRKPCFAVIREYETLKYFIQEKRIIADAPTDSLIIDYFPAVDGKPQLDQQATVYTPHIEANLTETDSGQLKLLTLTASDGIVYKDKDKQFDGSTLFYDAVKSIVTVHGDRNRPCQYNGVKAGTIEWDLKTNKVNTEIAGPAILQLK